MKHTGPPRADQACRGTRRERHVAWPSAYNLGCDGAFRLPCPARPESCLSRHVHVARQRILIQFLSPGDTRISSHRKERRSIVCAVWMLANMPIREHPGP